MKCAICSREITGKGSAFYFPDVPATAHGRCIHGDTSKIHRALYPSCEVAWHDVWDHKITSGPVGVVRRLVSTSIVNGGDLGTMQFRPAPARDLLISGRCTAPCLVALHVDSDCECPCGGQYHGSLADSIATPMVERIADPA